MADIHLPPTLPSLYADLPRRLEIDAGTVELISWDDVRLELFGESEWRE